MEMTTNKCGNTASNIPPIIEMIESIVDTAPSTAVIATSLHLLSVIFHPVPLAAAVGERDLVTSTRRPSGSISRG